MVDYREILRLDSLGYTRTDIAASVHSSRNTIQEVLDIAEALQIKWPLDDDVTNYTLESILNPERHKQDEERLLPDYPRIHKELAKKGVTLTLLWTEYCMEAQSAGKKPYSASINNLNLNILPNDNPTHFRYTLYISPGLTRRKPCYLKNCHRTKIIMHIFSL